MRFDDMTFAEVAEVNRVRCLKWHDADTDAWTLADWSNAMCGEAGEAANVVKKLRRHQTRTASPMDPPEADLRMRLGDELADVVLYLLLLADAAELDLTEHLVAKFNAVSIRQGFPDRLRGGGA